MRPINPRVGGGRPMPGPAVNVLPNKPTGGAPVIGGGGPMPMPRPTSMPMTNVKPTAAESAQSMQNLGRAFANQSSLPGMKKGGSASSRADGCAMRGKTKGKIV